MFGGGEADKLARGKSAIFPSACILHARRVDGVGNNVKTFGRQDMSLTLLKPPYGVLAERKTIVQPY